LPGFAKSSDEKTGEKAPNWRKSSPVADVIPHATTALFGVFALLIGFYPKLMAYPPTFSSLFRLSSTACCSYLRRLPGLYWYGWDAMQSGGGKVLHLFLGFLPTCFAPSYHDRAELMGGLPGQPCG